MKRKGFWESTGLVAGLILLVIGLVILIAFVYGYGKGSGEFAANLQGKIVQSMCNSIGPAIRWALNC